MAAHACTALTAMSRLARGGSVTPERAWCGPGKYKGQSAFSQCFSRAKGAALGGLEARLLCLGRGVAPAAADLAGAGLTEHGGGGGSRWSGALKRV
jgi:hypothetical protein